MSPLEHTPEEFARLKKLHVELIDEYRSLKTVHEQVQEHNRDLLREVAEHRQEIVELRKLIAANPGPSPSRSP